MVDDNHRFWWMTWAVYHRCLHHSIPWRELLMINVLSNQAASSHVKRLVGERGDWEVEVERLRSIFSHQEEGDWDLFCVGVG